ncbi:MAG: hypothetical protein DMD53_09770 [Gemmatimonadetes bacterium]|nr:MAG: hypothetical protein DMD53_09770 [Gemmatimonadota bacterium]
MQPNTLPVVAMMALTITPVLRAQVTSPQFRDQINAAVKIRAVGAWGRAELTEPRVDADTIRYSRARVLASFSTPSALPQPRGLVLPQPLPLEDLTEIQVPSGNDAAHGAVAGGLLLGLIGLVAGVATSSCDSCLGRGASAGNVIGVALIGGAIGAGIGALLGSTSTRWMTVYRTAPSSTSPH